MSEAAAMVVGVVIGALAVYAYGRVWRWETGRNAATVLLPMKPTELPGIPPPAPPPGHRHSTRPSDAWTDEDIDRLLKAMLDDDVDEAVNLLVSTFGRKS